MTVRHIMDTIGCAIGGFNGVPCVAARKIAAAAENVRNVISDAKADHYLDLENFADIAPLMAAFGDFS